MISLPVATTSPYPSPNIPLTPFDKGEGEGEVIW